MLNLPFFAFLMQRNKADQGESGKTAERLKTRHRPEPRSAAASSDIPVGQGSKKSGLAVHPG